jgi:hypothetical protein
MWQMRSAASVAALAFSPPSAFGLGDDNTNACPPGSGLVPMDSAAACQSAVAVAGSLYNTYLGTGVVSYLPKGCVWFKAGGSFYFNTDRDGAPRPFAQPVCAGAHHLLRRLSTSAYVYTLYRRRYAYSYSIPKCPCICPPSSSARGWH